MKALKKLLFSVLIITILVGASACDFAPKTYTATDEKYFEFVECEGGYAVKAKDVTDLPDSIALPKEFDGKSVVAVADGGFKDSAVKSVVIPGEIISVGEGAFMNCIALEDVHFFKGVVNIGARGFYGCAALKKITMPSSLQTIGASAFYGCSAVTSVTVSEAVKSIGQTAFAYCTALSKVYIPRAVESIGEHAFDYCAADLTFEISAGNEHYTLDPTTGFPTAK